MKSRFFASLTMTVAPAFLLASMPVLGSQATYVAGEKASACVGGPPQYCAETSPSRIIWRSAIPYTQTDPNDGGPAVGVPFADPDTGTRITRVTDGMTEYGTGLPANEDNNMSNASAEAYTCSNFNPAIASHGGYLCWYQDQGAGGYFAFMIDATTMQTQVLQAPSFSPTGIVANEVSPA
ncbi:MAG: hypothetical protein ACRD10_01430, partial [Terriglobia bacterium]